MHPCTSIESRELNIEPYKSPTWRIALEDLALSLRYPVQTLPPCLYGPWNHGPERGKVLSEIFLEIPNQPTHETITELV